MIDDLIYEALEHAFKDPRKEKKMNILIQNIDRETVELVNTLIDSENTKRKVEKGMREALDEQQKAETMEGLKEIVKPVKKFLEDYYKMFPYKRPKEDIKRRPFDDMRIDSEHDLLVGK